MNSLGLDKHPSQTRVVVAMSGGVDSSVAAALLKREGYDVVGITLQLYDHGQAVAKKGACCAGQDIYDAKRVADRLDMPHYVLGYESRFRQAVIDDFADSYLAGETPIPCVRCNERVKFRDLLETARELDADCLATGHYVQRVAGSQGPELHRAVDDSRDQSYFLFATTPEQLDFLRFPLGGRPKTETRRLAEELGLAVADKPDSQDICFVPQGSYAEVVKKLRPGSIEPGEIVDMSGNVVGRHEGIIHFTIGQRRGLNVGGFDEPMYVVRLEPEARRVVVGPQRALARDVVHLREVNWLYPAPVDGQGVPVSVKLRSAMMPQPATVYAGEGGTGTIVLDTAQNGISPGQAAVFYDGARVLGGGWIDSASLSEAAKAA
ncbi:tRNA 2-thiouridine(34) synthase MnmA [Ferruginivarius sediminum]|uniref:tRNA-specific 2-thiouridylase MnmA n=1 Tax=Ferruginivarius sediminum TaxID=2661937 RepID=A0A369TDB2_9PROT|nr:tRNA 2-thiouridine(34) synthase MnmA [Ferruginivarius sediminum]RDD62514.1 tRNA 2-thiouridine(34) synthase MnmA [Ferruginivarius sediminum]